jgi:APA family basic amino acid/polyamine antiporter
MSGPRAFQAIGEDHSLFNKLAKTNKNNIPVNAILLLSSLSILFILTSSFKFILVFAGFTLGLSNYATVIGLIILRIKQPHLKRPYKTWLYPVTPILYLILMGWTLTYVMIQKPMEALMSLGLIVLGVIAYFVSKKLEKN